MTNLVHREEINLYDVIKKSFPDVLIKDLTENERICPVCNGFGMRIEDNIYGIKGGNSEVGKKHHFPYRHQALSFCRSCFNGVQRLCPYCGEPYKNQGYLHCDCDGQKKADDEKKLKEWNEKVANANPVEEKDVNTMLYCEEFDKYYETTEDFFDDYSANYTNEEIYIKPERLWVTLAEEISIDAGDVIEDACDGLWEEASEQCDREGLQDLLDNWCKKQTGATTYYPCYKEYVIIDWNQYV